MNQHSNAAEPAITAHGMGGEAVAPDWAPLTLPEVQQLLRGFPQLGEVCGLQWHSPRPFAAGGIALTSAGQVFIKRHHHSVRDVAGLLEEHRFIAHLHAAGLPVAQLLPDAGGATAVALGEYTYEVHSVAQGVDLYRDAMSWTPFQSAAHAYAAGRALARLHQAAHGYQAPPRRAAPLVSSFSIFASDDPLSELARFIEARPALAQYLANRPWQADVERELLPFYRQYHAFHAAFAPLWTHNDWHASNLLWTDAGPQASVATVLDFGLSDRTFALYDLATAIERNIVEWLALPDGRSDVVHYALLDALLEGYASLRPLSAEEAAALPALLPLVHAEFALSEVDYFHGNVQSPDNAALAYEAYLLGHAAWFNTPPGQALLDHLRRR